MTYKYLIFDVDDTLLDFHSAFMTAQRNIAEKLGIEHLKNIQNWIKNVECNPKECLMIGDSITNDISGAKAAGMDVCFYNIKNKVKPQNIVVDYEITSMQDLLQILL